MLQLLHTKIILPPLRPRQIERKRLLKHMNEGVLRALTLVVAPAGFGKTTMLTSWAQDASIPIAWLSLDTNDQNPERFLIYLLQALQQIDPKIGQTAQALLYSGQSITKEGTLYSLINDLAEIPHELALFLDDYHAADNPKTSQTLQFLLEHRPNNFHIVLASRNTPSLTLTRLRALDQVSEISADDLRFTDDEILRFVEDSMGLNLRPSDLDYLKKSTEGWAVGLQLAALALTRKAENWQLPAGQAHIFDYLAQEVLRREPAHVQDFMLCVSLFDRFSAPLCEALFDEAPHTEQPAAEILAYIERANLFLFPLDNTGTWYRFHALFADFLRQKIEKRFPDQIFNLYRKASLWFEAQGILDEAVHYATHGQDFERAADLLETHYREIIQGSQQVTLLEWLLEIPTDTMNQRPLLWLIRGWASAVSMDTTQARICAEKFESLTQQKGLSDNRKGELKALRIMTDLFEGKSSTTEEITEAFVLLSKQDDFLHLLLHLNLGMMSLMAGETQPAVDALSEVLNLTHAFDNPLITTMASSHLGETYTMRGELDLAEDAFQYTFRYIQEFFGENSFLLALPHIGYAELLRERNFFDEAQYHAEQGLASSQLWQPTASLDAKIVLARIQAALGNWEQAYKHIESAIQTAKGSETLLDDTLAATHFVRLKLLQGDIAQAVYWAKSYNIETRSAQMPYFMQEFAQLVQLRTQILSTEKDIPGACRAADELLPLIEKAQQWGRKTNLIVALILRTYALQQAGKTTLAVDSLQQALTLGAESGYVRVFADEGPRLRLLLEGYRTQLHDLDPYLEMLLSIMGDAETQTHGSVSPPKDLIPLTRRELDVLYQIAAGKSNQEIAKEFVLALNTVKKHVANILSKLGVSNRTQAVMVARDKGWLE